MKKVRNLVLSISLLGFGLMVLPSDSQAVTCKYVETVDTYYHIYDCEGTRITVLSSPIIRPR